VKYGGVTTKKKGKWKSTKWQYYFLRDGAWVASTHYWVPEKKVYHAKGTFELDIGIEIPRLADMICGGQEFHDYLIFNKQGKVTFRKERFYKSGISSGVRISRLDQGIVRTGDGDNPLGALLSSLKKSPSQKGKGETGDSTQKKFSSGISYTIISDVKIAGKNYKLFVQPLFLSFLKNLSPSGNHGDNPLDEWFIGGLVNQDTYQRQSRAISANWLLLLFLLLILLLISFPIIKYFALSTTERFKVKDASLLGVFMVLIVPIALYSVLTATHYLYYEELYSWDVTKLAERIHDDFLDELNLAGDQLNWYIQNYNDGNSPFLGTIKTIMDHDTYERLFKTSRMRYPFFDMVCMIDKAGMQIHKQMVGDFFQPPGNTSERKYYSAINEKDYWYLNGTEPVVLDPHYSYSTGEYEINMAKPVGRENILAAAISLKPLTVINPVLPYGYEFAIVDRRGKILFHSNERLNSFENIISECGNSLSLSAALQSRNKLIFNGMNYHGKSCNLFLRPIDDLPWTLVVMQDREVHASRNFIVNAIAGFTYLRYVSILGVLLLLLILLLFIQKQLVGNLKLRWVRLHRKVRWLWPEPRFSGIYLFIGTINLLIFCLLILNRIFGSPVENGIFLIPFFSVLFSYTLLMSAILGMENADSRERFSPGNIRFFMMFSPLAPVGVFILLGAIVQSFLNIPESFRIPWPIVIVLALIYWSWNLYPGAKKEIFKRLQLPVNGSGRGVATEKFRGRYLFAIYSSLLALLVFPALHYWVESYSSVSGLQVNHQHIYLAQNYGHWKEQKEKEFGLQFKLMQNREEGAFNSFSWLNLPGIYTIPSHEAMLFAMPEHTCPELLKSLFSYLFKKGYFPESFIYSDHDDFTKVRHLVNFKMQESNNHLETDIMSPKSIQEQFSLPVLFVSRVLMPNKCFRQICFLNQPQDERSAFVFFQKEESKSKYSYLKYSETYKTRDSIYVWTKSRKEVWGFLPNLDSWLPGFQSSNLMKFYVISEIVLLLLFITVGLYLIVRLITKIVFLVPFSSRQIENLNLDEFKKDKFKFPGKWIVLGDSVDEKTVAAEFKGEAYKYFNCAKKKHCDEDWDKLMDQECTIVIANFEYEILEDKANLEKLKLLEKFAATPNARVIIFSQCNPLDYVSLVDSLQTQETQEEHTGLKVKWEWAMAHFHRRYYFPIPDMKTLNPELYADCRHFLNSDCSFIFPGGGDRQELQEKKFAPVGKDIAAFNERFYWFARPVYEKIWKSCTYQDKIALIHLAEDRLVNVKNKEVITELLNRGLMKLAPIRLTSESFKRFVLKVEDRKRLLEWHREKMGGGIRSFSHPFLLLVGGALLFLMLTQPTILRSGMIIFPALASAIPALMKVFDLIPGFGPDSD
jgi:hypothetical protein